MFSWLWKQLDIFTDGNPYETIRGMWEIAYVSQFLRLFQNKLGTVPLNTQILEDALIDNSSLLVPDICARLLRYLTGSKNILITNFEDSIQRLLKEQTTDFEPSRLNVGWKDQNPEEKLGVLKWLVDHVYKEKEEELTEFLDDHYNADDLRGICAGQDAFNNVYWYLDDLRLYRENSWKKPSKKEWECVCSSLSDWTSFLKQFRKTTNSQERALYTYLNQEVFPVIEGQLQDLSNKQAQFQDNHPILDRERRELEEMLEKKQLTCNGESTTTPGTVVNGGDMLNGNVSDGNAEDFLSKPDEIVNGDKNGLNMDLKAANPLSGSCNNSNNNPQENCVSANLNGSSMIGNPANTTQNRENTQDGNIQSYPDHPSENSNKENVPAPRVCSVPGEISPVSAMSSMVGSSLTPTTTVAVQPLPSNIITKSNVSMETQYMQQQSQIFVFSTALANKAAEVVISGQYSSIIGFHCSQPGTKRFLEKNPLKIQQFNRQNPAVWLNNLAQMKQGNRQIKPSAINAFPGNPMMNHQFSVGPPAVPGPVHCTGPCTMHGNGPAGGGGPQNWPPNAQMGGTPGEMMFVGPNMQPNWTQQQQMGPGHFPHQRFPNPNGPGTQPGIQSMGPMGCPTMGANNSFQPGYMNSGNMGPMNAGGPAGTVPLQGVKIPDENLTPQQRQHREEQLAMIRKMHQILFPDQHPNNPQNMCNMAGMGPRHPGSEVCVHGPVDNPMYPHHHHHHCSGDHEHSSADGSMFPNSPVPGMGPQFPQQPNMPPTSMAAQMEWQKLQQTFYEEQRRTKPRGQAAVGCPSTSVSSAIPSPAQQQAPPTPTHQTLNSPSPNVVMSPGARMQGPPPPYHNAGSRGAPMQSPHPTSPSTLSLPSPHMASGLASPADSRQFSQPVQQHNSSRLPHPSPGTAGGGGSMHSTPLNSPKPNQGSNGGSLVRTPTTPNPIPTPTSTPSSSAMNSMLPSPSPTSSTGPGSVGSRKNRTTPVTQHPALVSSASQDGSLPPDFSPISQTASSGQGENFLNSRGICPKNEPGVATGGKELSLMPVPSPQQIQYLNTFDGQELTIQKQPNTSLRETDLISPGICPPNMEMGGNAPQQGPYMGPDASDGPFMAQGPMQGPEGMQTRFPGHLDANRFPINSPHMPRYEGPTHRFMTSGPQHMDVQRMHGPHSFDGFTRMPGHMGMQPGMDGPVARFQGQSPQGFPMQQMPMEEMVRFHSASETLQRFRGPNPHGASPNEMMQHRFPSPHMQDTHHPQYTQGQMMPGADPQQFPGGMGPGMSSYDTHIHNLQKMAPPFEIVPNKMSDLMPLGSESPMSGAQSTGSQRLSHFDPIASMVAMSETSGPMVSTSGPQPNMLQMSAMQSGGPVRGNPTNMVNFQGMHPGMNNAQQQQQQPYGNIPPGHMSPNVGAGGGGQQTTYVNATMSIQQLNMQNLTTSAYSPGMHPNMMHQQMAAQQSTHTVSSSTSGHPIMHSGISPKGVANIGMVGISQPPRGSGPNMQPHPFPNGQRPMLRTPGATSYNSANVQVKASAPNTIQYLPARPQGTGGGGAPAVRAPSLDFLQRFASPLTNLDSKVPTHNLQYFPSGGPNGAGQVGSNIPSPVTGSMPPGQGMMVVQQRPMGMAGPGNMMRGPTPGQGGMGVPPNHVFVGQAGNDPAGLVFGRSPGPVGSPVMAGSPMFPGKQTPLSPGGIPPESTQPLPSSMAHSMNYKQMPFYGPTTADPNYAVQFHNFQQQLYATNTRNTQMGSQSGGQMPSGTNFFAPK